ncbi:MAG: hypothetical protein HYX87_02550 [Chloroflexi bacterium]|nr:hypothetical protein [Chloroflexota bacterium]
MKALKIVGIVVGSIIVLVLIIAGVSLLLLRSSPTLAREVTPVATNSQAAQQFDTKWDQFRKTASTVSPGTPVSLVLTQEEVNSKIAEELAATNLPDNIDVKNVNINLKDGGILASARVNYSGVAADIGVKAKVEVVDGQTKVVVESLEMGKMPIPQSVKDSITSLIPNGGTVNITDLPINIQDVQIIDGQIVLKGVKK